ncbi:MAG TPA: guanylate kinase [Anaerolineae bacterium]|nr:guanylate kinase [Anaerolineae bacterium]
MILTQIDPYERIEQPMLVVISGPSGVGKDMTINRMKELGYPFYFVVTATTRPQRPGEIDGKDYFFVSMSDFAEMIEQDELLEYAVVYGDYKGIPKAQVRQALASGQDVIMRIDVQGAATIRRLIAEAILIYISAESEEALVRRLSQRKTEPEDQLKMRIATARKEQARLEIFDYIVINKEDRLDETCEKVAAIITAERCRVQPRKINL